MEKLSLKEVSAKARKAGLRGHSERSIRRAVSELKELKRDANGFFDSDEVDEWIERKQSQEDPDGVEAKTETAMVVEQLTQGFQITIAHAQDLFRLNRETTESAMGALVSTNKSLTKQLTEAQEKLVELQSEVGELLLRKAEIAAEEKAAESKAMMFMGVANTVAQAIPTIMAQAAGQRAMADLLRRMTPEEKELFVALGGELKTKAARDAYAEAMAKLGLVKGEKDESPDSN